MSKAPANRKILHSTRLLGKSIPRVDIAPKVLGKWQYVVDVRVPGMVHARVIRPSGVGATLVHVDDSAAKADSWLSANVDEGKFCRRDCRK